MTSPSGETTVSIRSTAGSRGVVGNAPPVHPAEPASPCTNACRLDPRTGWCLGCQRTLDEITGWPTFTRAEKRAVLARLHKRARGWPNPDCPD
ncbi:MAG: DUF1289 domain-containing protein [Nitrospira sp.]|nr:DUF1289 domain-containing protein [Nitrospira sp.]